MRVSLLALAALFVVPALSSCSDGGADFVAGACSVIVDTCHMGRSNGECIDDIGGLPAECIDCIAHSGCKYASCQAAVPGCRLPVSLMGK